MNLKQVKFPVIALEAPFRNAEVWVSLRSKIALFVLAIPGKDNEIKVDFELESSDDDPEQIGLEITEAFKKLGITDDSSIVTIIDLDSLPEFAFQQIIKRMVGKNLTSDGELVN